MNAENIRVHVESLKAQQDYRFLDNCTYDFSGKLIKIQKPTVRQSPATNITDRVRVIEPEDQPTDKNKSNNKSKQLKVAQSQLSDRSIDYSDSKAGDGQLLNKYGSAIESKIDLEVLLAEKAQLEKEYKRMGVDFGKRNFEAIAKRQKETDEILAAENLRI